MPILRIPTPLRICTYERSDIRVQGHMVSEALGDLILKHPALQPHLFNGESSFRPYDIQFSNEANIKDLEGLRTPLQEDVRLLMIPSIAGGCS